MSELKRMFNVRVQEEHGQYVIAATRNGCQYQSICMNNLQQLDLIGCAIFDFVDKAKNRTSKSPNSANAKFAPIQSDRICEYCEYNVTCDYHIKRYPSGVFCREFKGRKLRVSP